MHTPEGRLGKVYKAIAQATVWSQSSGCANCMVAMPSVDSGLQNFPQQGRNEGRSMDRSQGNSRGPGGTENHPRGLMIDRIGGRPPGKWWTEGALGRTLLRGTGLDSIETIWENTEPSV